MKQTNPAWRLHQPASKLDRIVLQGVYDFLQQHGRQASFLSDSHQLRVYPTAAEMKGIADFNKSRLLICFEAPFINIYNWAFGTDGTKPRSYDVSTPTCFDDLLHGIDEHFRIIQINFGINPAVARATSS